MGLAGEEDGIDHVDDAVAGFDIRLDHLRVVDRDAVLIVHRDRLAVDRLDVGAVLQLGRIGGEDLARDDVVGEDRDQLGLVLRLEEHGDGARLALLQLGESVVGGGESRPHVVV